MRFLWLVCLVIATTTVVVSFGDHDAIASSMQSQQRFQVDDVEKLTADIVEVWLSLKGIDLKDVNWAVTQVRNNRYRLAFGPNRRDIICEITSGVAIRMAAESLTSAMIPSFGSELAEGIVEYAIEHYPTFERVANVQDSMKMAIVKIEEDNDLIDDICIQAINEGGNIVDALRATVGNIAWKAIRGGELSESDFEPLRQAFVSILQASRDQLRSSAARLASIIHEASQAENRGPIARSDEIGLASGEVRTIDVLANDSDADEDSLTVTSVSQPSQGTASIQFGRVQFDARSVPSGSYSFTYRVSDGRGGTDQATVHVQVRPANVDEPDSQPEDTSDDKAGDQPPASPPGDEDGDDEDTGDRQDKIFGTRSGEFGDAEITLTWSGSADLDLHVIDPNKELIYWFGKTSASGGKLERDVMCRGGPERVYWEDGQAPSGEYMVFVEHYVPCDHRETVTEWTVEIKVDGKTHRFSGQIEPMETEFVARFLR